MEESAKRTVIIITNYNYGIYLDDCLKSCQNQGADIVLVDDASTDNSIMIAEKYGIRIIRLPVNAGYSHAKNIGIKATDKEFIVHLDADDILTEGSVAVRLAEFDKDPSLDMVHGLVYRYRDGKIDGYNKKSKIHAQGVMIRKRVYEKHGYYDEEMRSKSDKLMWYKLGVHPSSPFKPLIKVKKIKMFVALYRKHSEQMHKKRRDNKMYNEQIKALFNKKAKEYEAVYSVRN